MTVTDVAAVVPALSHNAALNEKARVKAHSLDWLDPAGSSSLGQFDVILGADIVWVNDLIRPMVRSMHALCTPESKVYFAYQSRSSSADEILFGTLREYGFEWHVVPLEALHPIFQSGKIAVYEMLLAKSGLSLESTEL